MDKLKPVLTHKFWILSFVALVVATVGWYLGTSAQAKQIDDRTSVIDGLKPADGASTPNDDWMTKIGAVKVAKDERVKSAADFLWQQQKDQMKWPAPMVPHVEGKTFNTDLVVQARETYRGLFGREVERLRRIVDPYDWNMQANRWEGAVYLDLATLPLTDPATWQSVPPTSKEIWYLQEDVWLLESLLQSVRDLNDGAGAESNIIKAPVKQITEIILRGGDRAAMGAGAMGADGSMAAGVPGMESMSGEMMMESMGGMGMGGMSGMGGAAAGGVDFSMDDEVGPAGMAMPTEDEMAAEGTETMATGTDAGGAGMMSGMGGMGMGGMGMGGMGGNALLDQKRYVDDAPELPYKTRAFKLRVLMDHRLIPELLVELTNSPFPVNIERVHWVEANSDPLYPSSSGPSGMMGGGMGMSEGGYSGMMSGGARGSRPGASMMPSRPTTSPFGGARGSAPTRNPMGSMRTPGAMGGNPMGSMMRPPMGGSRSPMGGMRMPMGMPSGTDGGYESGMMEGMGYGGSMGGQGGDPYSQAMADAFLADVVIGGVMTIYRSPEDVETTVAEVEAGGEVAPAVMPAVTPPPSAETAPLGTAPAVDGTAPVETGPAVEGAAPAGPPPAGDVPAGTAPAGAAPAGTPPTDVGGAAPAPADPTAPPDSGGPPAAAPPADAAAPPADTADPAAADPVNGPPGS